MFKLETVVTVESKKNNKISQIPIPSQCHKRNKFRDVKLIRMEFKEAIIQKRNKSDIKKGN